MPQKLPPGGKWTPSEYVLLACLMEEMNARYQLTGPSAFNFYGLDQQVPNEIAVYNDKISGIRRIGGLKLILIKVNRKRLGQTQSLPNQSEVRIGTIERVLVDAIYDWSRFGTIPRAYGWVLSYLKKDQKNYSKLVNVALQFGNIAVLRRLGYLFQKGGAKPAILKKIRRGLPTSKGLIPLIPNRKSRGKVDLTWGIIVNE